LFNRSAVVGFYWDEFLFPYDPAGVKRRGEGERKREKNIEQGLTNRELRSKYLLHKSHINIPCSEINLQGVNENNINKEKRSSRGAPTLVFIL